MPRCAYCGNEVKFDNKIISYCKEGCHRTLFLCKCGSANRPIASYCRSCGNEVSYLNSKAQFIRSLKASSTAFDKPIFSLSLSELGITELDDLPKLYFSYGYLFMILKTGKILILNCFEGDIEGEIDLSGDQLFALPIEISDKQPNIFLFTARAIHRLDLIRDFNHELLMTVGEEESYIIHQPLYIDRHFFLALWNDKESSTLLKLISLDGDHKDLITIQDRISQPIKVKNKIFFYTSKELFVYDHADRSISSKAENQFGFLVDSKPKSDNSRAYAISDEDRIYRVNLDDNVPEILGLPHPQVMQVNFDVSDERIFISHSGGVIVTNVLGQVEWSSDELLSIYPAYKFPPISLGNHFAFVMSYPNTEALHVIERPAYKQAGSCLGNFLTRPAFYIGHIYVIVDEDGIFKLRAYSL
jgi:hypothetical protein